MTTRLEERRASRDARQRKQVAGLVLALVFTGTLAVAKEFGEELAYHSGVPGEQTVPDDRTEEPARTASPPVYEQPAVPDIVPDESVAGLPCEPYCETPPFDGGKNG